MIKCEVIETFTLGRFNELKNIVRAGVDTKGLLNVGDVFECEKDLADYLLGDNKLNRPFVKIIEIIPDEVQSNIEELRKIEPIEPIEKKQLLKMQKQFELKTKKKKTSKK